MADKAETPTEHPLNKPWCLWFKGGGKAPGSTASADDWDCGTLAFTFNTAENFWAMYNNIKPASKLPDKSDYYVFAEGIKPKYEDPKNEGGGEWRLSIPRGKDSSGNRRYLDDWFLHTALGCIGEILDETGEVISGVAVNIRKREDRVAIWTRTCDPAKVGEVGRRLRELLKVDKQTPIRFQTYADGKTILEA